MSAIIGLKEGKQCPKCFYDVVGDETTGMETKPVDLLETTKTGSFVAVKVSSLYSLPPLDELERKLEDLPEVAKVYMVSNGRWTADKILCNALVERLRYKMNALSTP
jgi:hypothetical protein